MRFTLPPGAFPPLALSTHRQRALLDEVKRVVDETVVVNEAFIEAGRVLRSSEWKLVRTKESIQVYQQRASASVGAPDPSDALAVPGDSDRQRRATRRRGTTASSSATETSGFSSTRDPGSMTVVEALKRPHIPLLVLHGVVEGTLDDTMYGSFADDDLSWRWRSAHINDRFDDAKLLATLARPDSNDPFRFAGVKWFAKEHPAVLSSFVHRRDFVIVEASGLTRDSQGHRVGYMLMHSVALRGVPELSELGIIRGCLSFCYLVRQRRDARMVEIFGRGFSDPLGDMMERVSVAIAAEALICAVSVVDYAYVKKLAHFAQQHKQDKQSGRHSERGSGDKTERCESCKIQPMGAGGAGGGSRVLSGILSAVTSIGTATPCSICRRRVCAKCSVLKKMTVDVSLHSAVQRTLRFCIVCVMQAKEAPAWDIAIRALSASRSKSRSASSASSSSTPSSSAVTPSSAPTPSSSTSVLLSTSLPRHPPLPRHQRSEDPPARSRVTRAYSQQIPTARFVQKTRFPNAPAATSPHEDARAKPQSETPRARTPGPTARSASNSKMGYDRSDAINASQYVPAPRRPPRKTPETVAERRSERIPYHAVL